jgi:sterol desaturase/sphingolipid hydroxylase (fatty acid hydroxylase superfamily)
MKTKELEIATTTYTVAYKKGYTQCQEDNKANMKNKILALLISLGCISLFLGLFLLLFIFPEMCWLYMGASMLFLIYQGYTYWLQKLTNKNK